MNKSSAGSFGLLARSRAARRHDLDFSLMACPDAPLWVDRVVCSLMAARVARLANCVGLGLNLCRTLRARASVQRETDADYVSARLAQTRLAVCRD